MRNIAPIVWNRWTRATLIGALPPGAAIVVLALLLVAEGREADRAMLQISERDSELRETSSDLQQALAEVSQLRMALLSIEQERDNLQTSFSALADEHGNLNQAHSALQSTAQDLSSSGAALQDSNSGLRRENGNLKQTVQRLEEENNRLEGENQAFKTAYESVESLEEKASGLRAVIGTLEDDRKALIVKSTEMFPGCSGSMEPKITCLDTVVVLQNFRPEDVTLGAIIAYHPPTPTTDNGQEAGAPILHRVTDIKVEDGVHYFWPKGDAEEEADGFWVPESSVLGYATALLQGTRPQNAALRDRVNGARDMHTATRARMLETRGIYYEAAIMYCGSIEDASSCQASPADFRKVLDAYDSFSLAWDAYLAATCQYHEAYYHGIHESEPKEDGPLDPYVAPPICSPGQLAQRGM